MGRKVLGRDENKGAELEKERAREEQGRDKQGKRAGFRVWGLGTKKEKADLSDYL